MAKAKTGCKQIKFVRRSGVAVAFKACKPQKKPVRGQRTYSSWNDEVEEDYSDALVTDDHVNFYQYGRLVLTLQKPSRKRDYDGKFYRGDTTDAEPGDLSDAQMWKQLDAYMAKERYYPGVYFQSDHGNMHLIERPSAARKARTGGKKLAKPGQRAKSPYRFNLVVGPPNLAGSYYVDTVVEGKAYRSKLYPTKLKAAAALKQMRLAASGHLFDMRRWLFRAK